MPNTFIATTEMSLDGAGGVVDNDREPILWTPTGSNAITPRTKAILPVH